MRLWQETFGLFNYNIPEDKEEQLYDFYTITKLAQMSSLDNKRLHGGIDIGNKYTVGDDLSEEDKIDYTIKEVQSKLVPQLKESLLDVTFFALASEFRHIFDQKSDSKLTAQDSLERTLRNVNLDKHSFNLFRSFANSLYHSKVDDYRKKNPQPFSDNEFSNYEKDISGIVSDQGSKPNRVNTTSGFKKWLGNSYDVSHKAVLSAIKKLESNKSNFVNMMKPLFLAHSWNSRYGGEEWANIAQAWLDLDKAKTISDMTIQIDHIYDIQHHSGSVLNKSRNFAKKSIGTHDFGWIKNALNRKAEMDDLHDIINGVSPAMKTLALRAIKIKTGQTLESSAPRLKNQHSERVIDAMAHQITLASGYDLGENILHPIQQRIFMLTDEFGENFNTVVKALSSQLIGERKKWFDQQYATLVIKHKLIKGAFEKYKKFDTDPISALKINVNSRELVSDFLSESYFINYMGRLSSVVRNIIHDIIRAHAPEGDPTPIKQKWNAIVDQAATKIKEATLDFSEKNVIYEKLARICASITFKSEIERYAQLAGWQILNAIA